MNTYKLKLLLTMLLVVMITGCKETPTKPSPVVVDPSSDMEITKIKFEGHSYIWVEKWPKRAGLTHDMNCKCFKFLWKNKSTKPLMPQMPIEQLQNASPDGL